MHHDLEQAQPVMYCRQFITGVSRLYPDKEIVRKGGKAVVSVLYRYKGV
jgi:hypothetical protein